MDVPFFPPNNVPLTRSIWGVRENISQHEIHHWKYSIGKIVIVEETYCL